MRSLIGEINESITHFIIVYCKKLSTNNKDYERKKINQWSFYHIKILHKPVVKRNYAW